MCIGENHDIVLELYLFSSDTRCLLTDARNPNELRCICPQLALLVSHGLGL